MDNDFDVSCWSIALERMPVNNASFWLRAIPLICINLLVVFGNLLVVVSVVLHRRLHSTTNYLVTSLAISDLLLGIVVLPFSVFFELSGQLWPFGTIWCNTWLSMDVWLCTASIYNLLAISYDRYMAVTKPINYRFIESRRIGHRLVVSAWLVSFGICAPPLIMAAVRASNPIDLSPGKLLDGNSSNGLRIASIQEQCGCSPLNNDPGYIVYSASGSFYIPMLLIFYLNAGIFLRARQAGNIETSIVRKNNNTLRSSISAALESTSRRSSSKPEQQGMAMQLLVGSGLLVTATNHLGDQSINHAVSPLRNKSARTYQTIQSQVAARTGRDELYKSNIMQRHEKMNKHKIGTTRRKSKSITLGTEPSYNNVYGSNGSVFISSSGSSEHKKMQRKVTVQEKRVNRERRVAKTIGIVIVCFVGCWLPFTLLYSLQAVYVVAVSPYLFAVCFWLGYCNSGLNPIIYALFSRELRRAFKSTLSRLIPCSRTFNTTNQFGNTHTFMNVNSNVALRSHKNSEGDLVCRG